MSQAEDGSRSTSTTETDSSPATVRRAVPPMNIDKGKSFLEKQASTSLSSKDFLPQQKMDPPPPKEKEKTGKSRPLSAPKKAQSKGPPKDEEESDDDEEYDELNVAQIDGIYNPDDYTNLNVNPEIKELFGYISQIQLPQLNSVSDVKLHPFIPDYYPSVGDIDAFIKVLEPKVSKDKDGGDGPLLLGVKVLDEPAPFQSDPSVLDLRLRALAKQSSAKSVQVKKVENVGKSSKVIENWIKDISDLHRSKPSPSVHYSRTMPDLDLLLQEWPPEVEEALRFLQLPGPNLSCELGSYVDLVCGVLDIPVYKSRIQSLHVLFSLFATMKQFTSQFNNNMKFSRDDEDGDPGVDRLHVS